MRPEKRLTAAALERTHRVRALLPLLIGSAAIAAAAPPASLSNGLLEASFGRRGLVAVRDLRGPAGARLLDDEFALLIDGKEFHSETLQPVVTPVDRTRVTYR